MKILVDKDILFAEEAFSTIGEVITEDGSRIDSDRVTDIDILVIRTITKVSEALVKNSRLKFIATATAGTDHVDLNLLKEKKIGFSSAPGANADAVGDFVINGLIRLAEEKSIRLKDKTLGIIGAGNTGTALSRRAKCLGMNCLLNDPPLAETSEEIAYVGLKELISSSDIISLHVPLTFSGSYPTHHLLNKSNLSQIDKDVILINTSRGGVLQEEALFGISDRLQGLMLDVWENEPNLNPEIHSMADIATPHVAGYSYQGKIKATEMAYQSACRYFQVKPKWISPRFNHQSISSLTIKETGDSSFLAKVMKSVYDIYKDDRTLRQYDQQDNPGGFFKTLRNNYSFRNEFSAFRLLFDPPVKKDHLRVLECLGFHLQ